MPSVIYLTYNAGISACEKGEQWKQALALLGEMREAKLHPNPWLATALASARARRAHSGSGRWRCSARCGTQRWSRASLLQRGRQCMREGRAVAAGVGPAHRDTGGQPGTRRFSYNAGISACEKSEQWQRALALLTEMREAKLEPNVISYSAGISACEKDEQWEQALAIFGEMCVAKVKPNVTSATTLGSPRARRASSGSGLWR
ncbi:unnamed protein product [Prorocentrum cordatum]|uniref:Pentacotripeptide-repeat region of PRORP domain-containing protein n=1 Tax=Prorocentrum cordatum TaxID=2364126 RepID=A0ABN9TMQ1_9DINO|nr:unnamed protein product [Polarella glacialis]